MVQKTISVSPDTHEQLDFYKKRFKMTFDELFIHFMDKMGLATLEEIRLYEKSFPNGQAPIKAEAE